MLLRFSLTWIDILVLIIAVIALCVRLFVGAPKRSKLLMLFLHPATLVAGFMVLIFQFSHY